MSQGKPPDAQQAAREEGWRQLMVQAQAGDTQAYDRLLRELLDPLRRMARRRWRDPNGIEDVVQDILLSIHSVRHTYDASRPFGAWVTTIAQRRIADFARRSYGRGKYETTVDTFPETFQHDDAKSDHDSSDDRGAVEHALGRLSPASRRAVELTKLQGLSLEEASQVTGKSVASLKVAVHRALKDMRRVLGGKS